jgi:hypothetical protein
MPDYWHRGEMGVRCTRGWSTGEEICYCTHWGRIWAHVEKRKRLYHIHVYMTYAEIPYYTSPIPKGSGFAEGNQEAHELFFDSGHPILFSQYT